MELLSDLERAVLEAIAAQVPEHATALRAQIACARVIERENTGVGFFTILKASAKLKLTNAPNPLGDIGADIPGIANGMGFLLWLKDGVADTLEGYTYGDEIVGSDLKTLSYAKIGPRLT